MIIRSCDFPTYGLQIEGDGAPPTDPKEQVVRDLHIGKAFRTPGDANRHELAKHVFLKPNDCILLETYEQLTVPSGVFGMVVSRAGLAAEGIIVASLKIDPLFNGQLTVTVINVGKRLLRVEQGMPFCSVFFQSMEQPAHGPVSRTPPVPRVLPTDWYKARIRALWPFLLTFGASVAASLIAAYIFIWTSGGVR
jgi:dUTPase